MTAGVLLAALAALAFGLSTPFVAWAGHGVGPLTTAALLYAGAAAIAAVCRVVVGRHGEALQRRDTPRLIVVSLFGAAVAPTLLAWGLQRAGATAGALLLNLEAVFTVGLASAFYREPIGRRVAAAVASMVLGGAVLAFTSNAAGDVGLLGALAVAGATLCWAIDNTWTRRLAERDPFEVIVVKAVPGAVLTLAIALVRGEPMPSPLAVAVLLVCGASGYGASLYFYLLAQRRIGAARTGSVFALAPFIGAAVGWALGDRHADVGAVVATALFAFGVYLHLSEHHGHHHIHDATEHEHMHRHDDGHHGHRHDPAFVGEHSHPHAHDHVEHDHPHGLDVHHDHAH